MPPKPLDIADKILSRTEIVEGPFEHSPCRIWLGYKTPNGYGYTHANGKGTTTHRALYEAVIGPIPKGHDACHKCDVTACVELTHLFPGTKVENMQDALRKGRLHKPVCRRGHQLSKENSALRKGSTGRTCRICIRASRRRNQEKSRVQVRRWKLENREHYNATQRAWYKTKKAREVSLGC